LSDPRPTILVTGIAGTLGLRLLPLLGDYRVAGVDLLPLAGWPGIVMHRLDLGHESSCIRLVQLLRESGAEAVVHLAAASNPVRDPARNPARNAMRNPATDLERMWQTNVAGTARVMEAISEVNRHGGKIAKFIYPSSVAVYGPETGPMVREDAPLKAHTLTYAVQKAEADAVVKFRAPSLGPCSTYLLRPQIFAGAGVENHMVNALRGQALGNGAVGRKMRRREKRLPLLLPMGTSYPQKLFQFVHVDDVARLIVWLLRRSPAQQREELTLNVAGSGSPISLARCAEIGEAKLVRLPSRWLCAKVLALLWKLGASAVPPDAFPYLAGSYTMSTERLRRLLGGDYEKVIRYSSEAALRDSLTETPVAQAAPVR
jgi:nucleoside-diphosphate-sugar epimerase